MSEKYGELEHVVPVGSDPMNIPKFFKDFSDSVAPRLKSFPLSGLAHGTTGQIIIVGSTGVAAYKAMSGDVTITESGATTIGTGKVLSGSLAAGAVTEAKLASAVAAALVPIGSIIATARTTAPTGFLLCDGSAVSRTTYHALWEAIKESGYGLGDGSTTFNLPDLRGRVPVGVDGAAARLSSNDALGNSAGEQNHTLTTSEMPIHNHGEAVMAIFANEGAANGMQGHRGGNGFPWDYIPAGGGGNAGNGFAHNNMQPYQVVNYLIKT